MKENKNYMSVIGQNIRALRAKSKTSQAQLAHFLGIQMQTVSKWEHASCSPDIEKLPEIAAFFGVSIDELFRDDGKGSSELALAELKKLLSELKFAELCEKALEYAIAFPQNIKFTEYLLVGAVQAHHCRIALPDNTITQAVNLGKRTAEKNADANAVKYNLCALLYLLKRNKEADFYYDTLCPITLSKQMLAHYRYTGNDRKNALEENIASYHAFIASSLSLIADKEKELSEIAKYRTQAIRSNEQAFAYTGNKRFLEINLSLMFAIRAAYAESEEEEKANDTLALAESYAREHSLESYFRALLARHGVPSKE